MLRRSYIAVYRNKENGDTDIDIALRLRRERLHHNPFLFILEKHNRILARWMSGTGCLLTFLNI